MSAIGIPIPRECPQLVRRGALVAIISSVGKDSQQFSRIQYVSCIVYSLLSFPRFQDFKHYSVIRLIQGSSGGSQKSCLRSIRCIDVGD